MRAKTLNYPWTDTEKKIFTPKPDIKVSELAAKIRIVTKGPAQGLWTNEFAPYLVEPMDTFNIPWVRKIFLCFAPQTGKTQIALNCLLYCAVIDPGDAFYLMPDEKVTKRIANRQIVPMLRATPESKALLGPRAEDVSNLKISFTNGMDLMMAWATSPAAMASESARYMFYDEPGKYPDFVGQEADPFSLGDVRTNSYPYTSKQLYFSTPKIDGDAFDNLLKNEPDETRRYHAKCPYCKKMQIMRFRNFHWGETDDHREVMRKKSARYRCEFCKKDWNDAARDKAVAIGSGRWIAENPVERPIAIAFGPLESWYSPMISLSKAVAAYLRGKKEPGKMQAFINQHKAISWKETVGTDIEVDELLKHKNDIPEGVFPDWAVALTAGIDVQKRGFWFVVRAWDAELNSHLVQYNYMATFDDVETLVFKSSFGDMRIWRAAIDTGGGKSENEGITRTDEVYAFLIKMRRKYGDGVLYGVKGASRGQFQHVGPERSIDSKPQSLTGGGKWRGMLTLRMVDTFTIKKIIHWRLTRREEHKDESGQTVPAENQRFYLHSGTGMDYANQFLAEELRKDRNGLYYWHQKAANNHYLDCEVYAAACADDAWAPSLTLTAAYLKQSAEITQQPQQSAGGRGVRSRGLSV